MGANPAGADSRLDAGEDRAGAPRCGEAVDAVPVQERLGRRRGGEPMTRRSLVPAVAAIAAGVALWAAPRAPRAAERIAAIVNKNVILSSDVDDQAMQAAQ